MKTTSETGVFKGIRTLQRIIGIIAIDLSITIIQYYKLLLSTKRIHYSKFLYIRIIIVALSIFFIFASTTTIIFILGHAQNATDSKEIDTLFETANTLFKLKKNMMKQSSTMTKF